MTFHPIYVDVDMLVSVAAALHSPSHSADPSTRSDSLPPGFDLKALLADVTGRAPARPGLADGASHVFSDPERMRQRTEALLAIRLYEHLGVDPATLSRPPINQDLGLVTMGSLIEVSGILSRGYLERVHNFLEAVCLTEQFGDIAEDQGLTWTETGEAAFTRRKRAGRVTPAERLRDLLAAELRRMAFRTLVLAAVDPGLPAMAVVLRADGLEKGVLAELHGRVVRVVAKISRVVAPDQEIGLMSGLGSGLIRPGFLEEYVRAHIPNPDVSFDPGAQSLPGPAALLAPLMILA